MTDKRPTMQDRMDNAEYELTTPGYATPRPSWDERTINEMMRPGKGAQDPKSRSQRRKKAVQPR